MTGEIRHDGNACKEHAIFHREQAEQLRDRLAPDRDGEGAEEHRRDAEGKIDLRERHFDGAEQRVGDDVGKDDEHRGDQQRAWDVEHAFDFARASGPLSPTVRRSSQGISRVLVAMVIAATANR